MEPENTDIIITKSAALYLESLLTNEPVGTNIKITVSNPGTIYADIKISIIPPGEEETSDLVIHCATFIIFVEEKSKSFLREAKIDFIEQDGDELTINAPYLKQNNNDTSSLTEKIQGVIDNEINPILETHGGMIALEGVIDDSIVLLRFGGGCYSCRLANVTFQQTVEQILRQYFPQLKEIRNVTEQIETY
jgi:Fe/S biogenesis protein NfuA